MTHPELHPDQLAEHAQTYLQRLCVEIPNRRVGSEGNRAATDFFQRQMAAFGFHVETQPFACMDWRGEPVQLSAEGVPFAAFAAPYSTGCAVQALLRVVTTVEELAAADLSGAVVLLRGAITQHQLMPKNFPFYQPEEHQQIIRLLETKQPLAILAATTRDPDAAGSISPFPLIEDGDFDIASVYMTDDEGARLAGYAGRTVTLISRAQRIPATGWNVVARRGGAAAPRIVCFAHIDAKLDTPGALDNASGVVVLLLLAELLAQDAQASTSPHDDLTIELVALNGEDYYAASGEQVYLARNAGQFDQIVFGINMDMVGYRHGRMAYSFYACPDEIAAPIQARLAAHPQLVAGESWIQSDHFLFLMHNRPALALTSEAMVELMTEITHTPADTPDLVDPAKLVAAALALHDLLPHLGASTGP